MSSSIEETSIILEELTVPARLGILKHEHESPQDITISATIGYDFRVACISDDIAHTLDYAMVVDAIKQLCLDKHYGLCEHLAHVIGSHIIDYYGAKYVSISVSKPVAIPEASGVGISLTLYAEDYDVDPEFEDDV